jgi:hypothetical protein
MDIMYVQYTHMFKYVKVGLCRGREDWSKLGCWILAFTPEVANLSMIVRRSDPGVAGIVAVD